MKFAVTRGYGRMDVKLKLSSSLEVWTLMIRCTQRTRDWFQELILEFVTKITANDVIPFTSIIWGFVAKIILSVIGLYDNLSTQASIFHRFEVVHFLRLFMNKNLFTIYYPIEWRTEFISLMSYFSFLFIGDQQQVYPTWIKRILVPA